MCGPPGYLGNTLDGDEPVLELDLARFYSFYINVCHSRY